MRTWKRILVIMIALALCMTSLPLQQVQAKSKKKKTSDIISYNLGDQQHKLKKTAYKKDGSYTIDLGTDPFFPYEVQFTYNGKKETRWFETEKDVETVNGHKFKVSCNYTGTKLTQLSLKMKGKNVAVYPKKKTFTNKGTMTIRNKAYIPIVEQQLELYLNKSDYDDEIVALDPDKKFTPLDLMSVSVKDFVAKKGHTISDGSKMVFRIKDSEAEYRDVENGCLDLWTTSNTYEVIVGADGLQPNQLSGGDVRYILKLNNDWNKSDYRNWLSSGATAKYSADGTLAAGNLNYSYFGSQSKYTTYSQTFSISQEDIVGGASIFLKTGLGVQYAEKRDLSDIRVYKFDSSTSFSNGVKDLEEGIDITDEIFGKIGHEEGCLLGEVGKNRSFTSTLYTKFVRVNESGTPLCAMGVEFDVYTSTMEQINVKVKDDPSIYNVEDVKYPETEYISGTVRSETIHKKVTVEDSVEQIPFYLRYGYYSDSEIPEGKIDGVYEGIYNTKADAEGHANIQADITNKSIGVFIMAGQQYDFTVFCPTSFGIDYIYQFHITLDVVVRDKPGYMQMKLNSSGIREDAAAYDFMWGRHEDVTDIIESYSYSLVKDSSKKIKKVYFYLQHIDYKGEVSNGAIQAVYKGLYKSMEEVPKTQENIKKAITNTDSALTYEELNGGQYTYTVFCTEADGKEKIYQIYLNLKINQNNGEVLLNVNSPSAIATNEQEDVLAENIVSYQFSITKESYVPIAQMQFYLKYSPYDIWGGSVSAVYEGTYQNVTETVGKEDIKATILDEDSGIIVDTDKQYDYTVFVPRTNQEDMVFQIHVSINITIIEPEPDNGTLSLNVNSPSGTTINTREEFLSDNLISYQFFIAKKNVASIGEVNFYLTYRDKDGDEQNDRISAAYEGVYQTIEDAVGKTHLEQLLFGSGTGITVDPNQQYAYTIFVPREDKDTLIFQVHVDVSMTEPAPEVYNPPDIGPEYSNFRWENQLRTASMSTVSALQYTATRESQDDSYGDGNVTTFLVDESVNIEHLMPVYWSDDRLSVIVHAFEDGQDKILSEDGFADLDFSKGPIQFTVYWSDKNETKKDKFKNYWISVKKAETDKPSLYINSLFNNNEDTTLQGDTVVTSRHIVLGDTYKNQHNMLLVNMGSEPVEKIKVELDDSLKSVVKLDNYWTLNGERALGKFPGIAKMQSYYDEAGKKTYDNQTAASGTNIAKISIRANSGIDSDKLKTFSGKMYIKSGSKILMEIQIIGAMKDSEIITEKFRDSVKYVPYRALIQNNIMYESVQENANYELVDGKKLLTAGFQFTAKGAIYGVPKATGDIPFSVRMSYKSQGQIVKTDKVSYILHIKDNTDENVEGETDIEYTLKQRFPATVYGTETEEDYVMVSEGEYEEFNAGIVGKVFLDGELLEHGVDYDSEEGSTRIIIKKNVIQKQDTGNHTLAIEFRKEDNEMKKAAQNFTKSTRGNNNNSTRTNQSNSSGSNSSGSSGSSGSGSSGSSGSGSSGSSGSGTSGSSGTTKPSNPTPSSSTPSTPAQVPINNKHIVTKGETLGKLAKKYYGDASLWKLIYNKNKSKVVKSKTAKLKEGIELVIPVNTNPIVSTTKVKNVRYKVQAGETLAMIAIRYYGKASKWKKIYKANKDKIKNKNVLKAGVVLKIPT